MRTSLPLIVLAAALLPGAALADQRAFRPHAEGIVGGIGIQRDARTPLGMDGDRGGSGILGGARGHRRPSHVRLRPLARGRARWQERGRALRQPPAGASKPVPTSAS